jgi:D-3-phosphoglycerate dehydrogenase / 2-oxoglutarate reductase
MKIAVTATSFSFSGFREGFDVAYNPFTRRLTEDEAGRFLAAESPVAVIAGVEPLSRRVLEGCPSLRVISRCGSGLDSVDLPAAEELGIVVLSTPDAPVESVSEMCLTLILSLLKNIQDADLSIKKGEWQKPQSRLLKGKTAGIIGCGRIGSHVARLLNAFGCRTIGYDPSLKKHDLCELIALDAVLEQSDILSLHVPLTDATRSLISDREIKLMKADSILVNTSRGGIVDESALFESLQAGRLAGAALDVFENEPYQGPLSSLKSRVILTPHMASSAKEAKIVMDMKAYENLEKGLIQLYLL